MTETQSPNVWATFHARDAHAMLDFLTNVFGFEATAVYEDGDRIAHAQLNWPEGGGIMFGSHKPNQEWNPQPGTAAIYVATDHVDEVFSRVKQSSARILREPQGTDYGSYEFGCADPEGNLWSFGVYRGEPRKTG